MLGYFEAMVCMKYKKPRLQIFAIECSMEKRSCNNRIFDHQRIILMYTLEFRQYKKDWIA